jgi:hypothetical protein
LDSLPVLLSLPLVETYSFGPVTLTVTAEPDPLGATGLLEAVPEAVPDEVAGVDWVGEGDEAAVVAGVVDVGADARVDEDEGAETAADDGAVDDDGQADAVAETLIAEDAACPEDDRSLNKRSMLVVPDMTPLLLYSAALEMSSPIL